MRPKPVRCCCGAKTDAVRLKNQARVQGESEFVLTPFLQSLRDQRGVHMLRGDVLVCQPMAESTFSALRSSGLDLDAGNPVGWVARTGLDQAGDHPGESFGVSGVVPGALLKLVEGGVVEFGCVSSLDFWCHNR